MHRSVNARSLGMSFPDVLPYLGTDMAFSLPSFWWRAVLHYGFETYYEAVMNRMPWMEDFQKNLSDLIAKSPAADVERNVRAMMSQAFSKMDLVTREEFDVQADLLARTRARLDQLAAQIETLQAERNTPKSQ